MRDKTESIFGPFVLSSATYCIDFPECQFAIQDAAASWSAAVIYEELVRVGVPKLDNPKLAIDLGANVGMWAFRMRCNYPDMRIKCIEPIPMNVKHLQNGIEINRFVGIEVIEKAITGDGRDLELKMGKTNTGSASIKLDFPDVLCESYQVSSRTLDEIVQDDVVDILKIDIEGAEYEALKTFTKWEQVKNLYLELHPHALDADQLQWLVDTVRQRIHGHVFIDSADEKWRLGAFECGQ